MNAYIKSHVQLAQVHAEEDTASVEMPLEGGRSNVLKKVRSLHINRHLLQANKNLETFIGQQNTDSVDPFGRVLRRLRTQQGLDAFVVASKACISVWQLYELENGEDTLFYTKGLRLKAAQRVAALLGSDWTSILDGRVVAKPLPAPGAQLHLLRTQRTQAQLQTAANAVTSAPHQQQSEHQVVEPTPLSSALFLRVPDSQGQ